MITHSLTTNLEPTLPSTGLTSNSDTKKYTFCEKLKLIRDCNDINTLTYLRGQTDAPRTVQLNLKDLPKPYERPSKLSLIKSALQSQVTRISQTVRAPYGIGAIIKELGHFNKWGLQQKTDQQSIGRNSGRGKDANQQEEDSSLESQPRKKIKLDVSPTNSQYILPNTKANLNTNTNGQLVSQKVDSSNKSNLGGLQWKPIIKKQPQTSIETTKKITFDSFNVNQTNLGSNDTASSQFPSILLPGNNPFSFLLPNPKLEAIVQPPAQSSEAGKRNPILTRENNRLGQKRKNKFKRSKMSTIREQDDEEGGKYQPNNSSEEESPIEYQRNRTFELDTTHIGQSKGQQHSLVPHNESMYSANNQTVISLITPFNKKDGNESKITPQNISVFSAQAATEQGSKVFFGASTGSIFGGTTPTGSIFGGTTPTGSIFGGTSSNSLFGGTTSNSLFGTPINHSVTANQSLFGNSQSNSLFGEKIKDESKQIEKNKQIQKYKIQNNLSQAVNEIISHVQMTPKFGVTGKDQQDSSKNNQNISNQKLVQVKPFELQLKGDQNNEIILKDNIKADQSVSKLANLQGQQLKSATHFHEPAEKPIPIKPLTSAIVPSPSTTTPNQAKIVSELTSPKKMSKKKDSAEGSAVKGQSSSKKKKVSNNQSINSSYSSGSLNTSQNSLAELSESFSKKPQSQSRPKDSQGNTVGQSIFPSISPQTAPTQMPADVQKLNKSTEQKSLFGENTFNFGFNKDANPMFNFTQPNNPTSSVFNNQNTSKTNNEAVEKQQQSTNNSLFNPLLFQTNTNNNITNNNNTTNNNNNNSNQTINNNNVNLNSNVQSDANKIINPQISQPASNQSIFGSQTLTDKTSIFGNLGNSNSIDTNLPPPSNSFFSQPSAQKSGQASLWGVTGNSVTSNQTALSTPKKNQNPLPMPLMPQLNISPNKEPIFTPPSHPTLSAQQIFGVQSPQKQNNLFNPQLNAQSGSVFGQTNQLHYNAQLNNTGFSMNMNSAPTQQWMAATNFNMGQPSIGNNFTNRPSMFNNTQFKNNSTIFPQPSSQNNQTFGSSTHNFIGQTNFSNQSFNNQPNQNYQTNQNSIFTNNNNQNTFSHSTGQQFHDTFGQNNPKPFQQIEPPKSQRQNPFAVPNVKPTSILGQVISKLHPSLQKQPTPPERRSLSSSNFTSSTTISKEVLASNPFMASLCPNINLPEPPKMQTKNQLWSPKHPQ